MIQGYPPIWQALFGTLFTWGLTAAGAAMAIVIKGQQRELLDASLGFASGVMLAASYWSLLEPAIEMAAESKSYGENGEFAFIPVAIGFAFGAAFVFAADVFMSRMGIHSPVSLVLLDKDDSISLPPTPSHSDEEINNFAAASSSANSNQADHLRRRRHRSPSCDSAEEGVSLEEIKEASRQAKYDAHWKRILLLIIAITVHNVPEGLAVGVGFGAVGRAPSATFESARNLAIGIGIQNFPEGLAVSLPLKAAGFSNARSIWYGQLSGLVEPIAGVLGAFLVSYVVPLLPYSLAFAAGAMVYVVVDDIIPEAQSFGNGKLASAGTIVGFIVMMSLDVGLA